MIVRATLTLSLVLIKRANDSVHKLPIDLHVNYHYDLKIHHPLYRISFEFAHFGQNRAMSMRTEVAHRTGRPVWLADARHR